MEKNLLRVLTVFVIIITIFSLISSIYAVETTFPSEGTASSTVSTAANKVWGTVVTIVQILAFAAVVFAGLRYMFASADQKADIKKSMGILTLGAILVFVSATVIQFITKAAGDILN